MKPQLISDGAGWDHPDSLDAPYIVARATIPVREAVTRTGGRVRPSGHPNTDPPLWLLEFGQVIPAGLVIEPATATRIIGGAPVSFLVPGLRMEDEPPFQQPKGEALLDFADIMTCTPCPTCGAPLAWAEAGNVPWYRVCIGPQHHRWHLDTKQH